jgi:putative phage-type endonuclease
MRINIQQRTTEWHQFRKGKIGSSDAATIMGTNRFETPKELWERMKGLRPSKQVTEAMQRGIDLEDDARRWTNKHLGRCFEPSMHEMDKYPHLIASLDGEDEAVLEIKVSDKAVALARDGKYFPSHYTQIQHQLMVTGHSMAYLCCYDGMEGNILRIDRNENYMNQLIDKELEFLECLKSDIPPPSQEKEYRGISVDKIYADLIEEWNNTSSLLKKCESREKEIRKLLIDLSGDENSILKYGSQPLLKLTKIQKEGNVDWKALCQTYGIEDLEVEKFRKQHTQYYQLKQM